VLAGAVVGAGRTARTVRGRGHQAVEVGLLSGAATIRDRSSLSAFEDDRVGVWRDTDGMDQGIRHANQVGEPLKALRGQRTPADGGLTGSPATVRDERP
jgi:hypothetical protein